MTAVLYTLSKAQFFDNNGDPLALGKLYAYTAGTLTPKDTYIDATGVSANTNPVILDAAGRADIWLNGAYKFILKDSTDVTIWTEDNQTSFTTSVTVPDSSITNAKLAVMAANSIKANNTASSTNPVDMTIAASKFPARAASGNLAAKDISDFGLSLVAAANAAAAQALLGSSINIQTFTASGTWTKPASGTMALIQGWGAGGGGGTNATSAGGGGGGFNETWVLLSLMASTETVTIGSGGAVTTAGGNSSLGTWLVAYGGGAASNSAAGGGGGGGGNGQVGANAVTTTGGAGGGAFLSGSSVLMAGPVGSAAAGNNATSQWVGGGGSVNNGGEGYYGGGGGSTDTGGISVWGGGGGGNGGAGGTSTYGGAGGTINVAGSAPSGGGGRNAAGARGEIRVYVF